MQTSLEAETRIADSALDNILLKICWVKNKWKRRGSYLIACFFIFDLTRVSAYIHLLFFYFQINWWLNIFLWMWTKYKYRINPDPVAWFFNRLGSKVSDFLNPILTLNGFLYNTTLWITTFEFYFVGVVVVKVTLIHITKGMYVSIMTI